jgi:TRAP-type mannitol/chloroaromatic compound transport system substrate-binding protein
MKRREFLTRGAAGAAAAGVLTGCGPQSAPSESSSPSVKGKKVFWRLASSFSPALDTIYGAAEVLSSRVESLTQGNFKIQVGAAGEFVPGLQVLDAVESGSVQVGHTASYYYKGKNLSLVFDTALPFGLTARQQLAWLYEGGGREIINQVYADFNVVSFPGGNTGTQMGGWFRRDIESLDDLNGLKMRIPGLGGDVMSRMGVTVQVIAAPEIYPALERGAIDATEWVGPYDDEKLGFHKVADHYLYPGWWEPGPSLSFLVNQGAWDALPADYKSAFEAASHEAGLTMLTKYDRKNPAALKRLMEAGITIKPFPKDVLDASYKAFNELVAEHRSEDKQFSEIYEQWDSFRKESATWFGYAESAYLNFSTSV